MNIFRFSFLTKTLTSWPAKIPKLLFAVTKGALGIQKRRAMRAYATYLTSCVQHGASPLATVWVPAGQEAYSTWAPIICGLGNRGLAQICPKLELDLQTNPSILARSFPTRALVRIEGKYSKNSENY